MSEHDVNSSAGYRARPAGGPRLRADIVDVYIVRRVPAGALGGVPGGAPAGAPGVAGRAGGTEFLQLLRAGEPLARTWQPVMGHIEPGETAVDAALRELMEEVGLDVRSGGAGAGAAAGPVLGPVLGLWALEQVHPYYVAAIDCVVLSPRFAALVDASWTPRLNNEHTEYRWVGAESVETMFMWPGQAASCREIVASLLVEHSLSRDRLKIDVGPSDARRPGAQ